MKKFAPLLRSILYILAISIPGLAYFGYVAWANTWGTPTQQDIQAKVSAVVNLAIGVGLFVVGWWTQKERRAMAATRLRYEDGILRNHEAQARAEHALAEYNAALRRHLHQHPNEAWSLIETQAIELPPATDWGHWETGKPIAGSARPA
jgi:cytochrome c-type biogenesis protein CcmH/NrfG